MTSAPYWPACYLIYITMGHPTTEMDMNRNSQSELLLTVEVAIERLSISRSKFYSLVASNKLAIVKIGRSTRIRESELTRFVTTL